MGDDAAETFLDHVLAAATICRQHQANKIPMKQLTQEQWKEYNNATNCWICNKIFKSADKKVRNHDHLAGGYRVQLIMHATCIIASIQRKWKFHDYSQPQRYIVSLL